MLTDELDEGLMSRRTGLIALPLLAVILTGCIRADFAIKVNDDGSGTVSTLLAVNRSLIEGFASSLGGESGMDAGEFSFSADDIAPADLPPGAEVEAYREGDFEGVRVTVPFEAGASVAERFAEMMSASGGGASDSPFEELTLERQGDEWVFEARPTVDTADLRMGTGSDQFSQAMVQTFFADASFTIRIELPGEVVEHNADEVNGRELVWNLDLFGPDQRTLMARSDVGGASATPWPLLVGIGAALVLLAAIGVYWLRVRRA